MGSLVRIPINEINATLELCDSLGLTAQTFSRIRRDPEFAKKVVRYAQAGGHEPNKTEIAKCIMGNHMIMPKMVSASFGFTYTEHELKKLDNLLFSEHELEKRKKDYILFPGHSFISTESVFLHGLIHSDPDCEKRFYNGPAQKETLDTRWYLIRKSILPQSKTEKDIDRLKAMIPKGEELPRAVEVVAMIGLYHRHCIQETSLSYVDYLFRMGPLVMTSSSSN